MCTHAPQHPFSMNRLVVAQHNPFMRPCGSRSPIQMSGRACCRPQPSVTITPVLVMSWHANAGGEQDGERAGFNGRVDNMAIVAPAIAHYLLHPVLAVAHPHPLPSRTPPCCPVSLAKCTALSIDESTAFARLQRQIQEWKIERSEFRSRGSPGTSPSPSHDRQGTSSPTMTHSSCRVPLQPSLSTYCHATNPFSK
jgi:hypothetical protein